MVFSDPPELVADPKSWTMDELAGGNFKIYEFPVTIACDGSTWSEDGVVNVNAFSCRRIDRRKEMSMIKQTGGVGFSAAGL